MGNRILKESVCTSASIERLSWFDEVCFYRLLVQCDDFGRMDARPPILRSRLFPLKETVTNAAVEESIQRLEEQGLIGLYEHEGLPFLQLLGWKDHQRLRSKRAKYPPAPWEEVQPNDTDLQQVVADV